MIEITTEKQGELMEHAEKAYKHLGKMLECIEQLGEQGGMGQREGDSWYIHQLDRPEMEGYGEREGYIQYRGGASGMEDGGPAGGMGYGNRRPNAGGYNGGLGMRGRGGMRESYGNRYQKMDPYYS